MGTVGLIGQGSHQQWITVQNDRADTASLAGMILLAHEIAGSLQGIALAVVGAVLAALLARELTAIWPSMQHGSAVAQMLVTGNMQAALALMQGASAAELLKAYGLADIEAWEASLPTETGLNPPKPSRAA